MASRTWLAVSLMLLIWFGWLRWFAPVPNNPSNGTSPAVTASAPIASDASKETLNGSGTSSGKGLQQGSDFAPIQQVPAATFSSENLKVELSANGGKISQITLPDFRETIQKESPFIMPVSTEKTTLSLASIFTDGALAEFSRGKFDLKQDGNKFVFFKKNKEASITKEYNFSPDSNFVDAKIDISFASDKKKEWGNLLIPVGTNDGQEYKPQEPLHSWEVVYYQNDEIKRINLEKIRKDDEAVHQGHTSWLAFGNRYFSSVVINQESQINPDVVVKKTENFNGAYLRYPIVLKNGQNKISFLLKIYAGPKKYTELSKVPGLKKLIDYGTFTVFAYPLLELLRFFYKFIHNYGVAIILLTILVRALFYPLSQKSMKSMKEMQKLQPKIAQLKEKYKDDQKRLNEEQMALFKAHKVNPAGGCLPMLVQLPVFIALYAVLGNSIELFHAPFFGWIQDLSTKDPFYIYPILMGAAMFVQQKMTPSASMDPAQQKMMYFMPVIFTFMMINLPSGLTLYIFVSTILGVLQQMALRDKGGLASQSA